MTTTPLTWATLTALEPRLAELLDAIQTTPTTPCSRIMAGAGICADKAWYGWGSHDGGYRARMLDLVGYDAAPDQPQRTYGHDAFRVAYDTLYSAIPVCPGCAAMAQASTEVA